MTKPIGQAYLRSCILAILFITPMMAEESGPIFGEARQSSPELQQTPQPAKWRRVRFSGGTCTHCARGFLPVTVYSDHDGEGTVQGYAVGKYRADEGKLGTVGNDAISSLQVAEGFMVRLCQDEGDGEGAGTCLDFAEGQHNVPDEMDNEASFVSVWRIETE